MTDPIVALLLDVDDAAAVDNVRARFRSAGSVCAGAVLAWPVWCHRKVEAISLLEGARARRRVSIDCTPLALPWPPSSERDLRRGTGPMRGRSAPTHQGAHQVAVPLTFIKKEPMRGLDVVDCRGQSVPVLGRRDNGLLTTAALQSAVDGDTQRPVTREQWRTLLAIACGSSAESGRLAERFIEDHNIGTVVAGFLRDAADNFLLCVLMAVGEVGVRQVVKYSFHWDAEVLLQRSGEAANQQDLRANLAATRNGIASKLGLRQLDFEIALGSASSAASYHLEVPAPAGLVCRSLDLPAGSGGQPHDDSSTALAHAYEAYENDPDGNAILRLDISTRGLHPLVAWSSVVTFLIFVLALGLPNALATLLANGPGANSLLLFGPATLLALLAGRRENVVAAATLLPFE